jgi:hypothetical protein
MHTASSRAAFPIIIAASFFNSFLRKDEASAFVAAVSRLPPPFQENPQDDLWNCVIRFLPLGYARMAAREGCIASVAGTPRIPNLGMVTPRIFWKSNQKN